MMTEKAFGKFLERIQRIQRFHFKEGTDKYLDVEAKRDDYGLSIIVVAYNTNVTFHTEEGEEYHFKYFYLYQFWDEEKNGQQINEIVEFLRQ